MTKKKKKTSKKLLTEPTPKGVGDYLRDLEENMKRAAHFDKELTLDQDGQFKFHWSNWSSTAKHLKKLFKNSPEALKLMHSELEKQKENLVWLKGPKTSLKSNIYELYNFYSDYKVRSVWFSKHQDFLISTHTESGPYITLGELRWLDRALYKTFVYKKMLKNSMSYRTLRVSCELPIVGYFDHHDFNSSPFFITQISSSGLFLKFGGGRNKRELQNSDEIALDIDLRAFQNYLIPGMSQWAKKIEALGENKVLQVTLETSILKKYGNKENLKHEVDGNYFIFVGLDDFIVKGRPFPFAELIGSFIESIEKSFTKELELENNIEIAS